MSYLIVCAVALIASGLTLISGFGLGTLLMPAFALFFPLHVAIAATAVVHLANNLFKLSLVGRHAHWPTVLRFGIPAAIAATVGALVLTLLGQQEPLATYALGQRTNEITLIGLMVGVAIIAFAAIEFVPGFAALAFPARLMPLGGVIAGFFGGLSGHQGALRSAFLVRAGLTKEQFIGTGTTCAVIIDLVRLAVYGIASWKTHAFAFDDQNIRGLVVAASLAAFAGAWIGTKLMNKLTLAAVQKVVAVMLVALGVLIAVGVV